MKIKKRFFIMLIGIFLIFNFNNVSAYLGLTPALIEVDFKPGFKFFSGFSVLGAEANQKLKVYASGDFAEYVKFDKTELTGSESFTAYVELPEKAEKPGKNRLYIKVLEVKEEGSGIGTRLEIGALILIKVPYPGKYAEIKSFSVNNANSKEPVSFSIEVESLGTEDIVTDASVEVYSDNKLIDEINFPVKIIKKQTSETFTKINEKGYESGVYNATAIVNYENVIKAEKIFKIGTLFVDVINWSSQFLKGKINPFNIEIESKWNNDIENVYAEVNVTRDGKLADYFKTPSVKLNRWEKAILKGFFNAEELETGKYKADIKIFYEGEITEKNVNIEIINEKTQFIKIIAIIIGIVLAIVIIIYFALRRRKNEKKQRKS